ncbi:MAG: thiamine ABC transporter substrate-binding protein, partial [Caldilineaceae bacterium]
MHAGKVLRNQVGLSLLIVSLLVVMAACVPGGQGPQPAGQGAVPTAPPSDAGPRTLVVATHDSFAMSEESLAAFEAAHNASLQFLTLGDAGEALNKVILSRDAPLADVFFGVDNTFLSRALAADLFVPYASPGLENIPDELELDPAHGLLPV